MPPDDAFRLWYLVGLAISLYLAGVGTVLTIQAWRRGHED